ncbi:hypothetical protein [Coleofasciculus sp. F4-SAH-05]|uniref:hypothetical protein n=1 Tax=Coleofasciculus sp. F4-SAH-05 TaxID=3069525 RepID=UPI0033029F01
MGATTTVFPSNAEIKRFLEDQGRGQDWVELVADEDAKYDVYDMINLSSPRQVEIMLYKLPRPAHAEVWVFSSPEAIKQVKLNESLRSV